jgi:hypothetical protein
MGNISGKIVDVNNEPLMGANITLRSGIKSGKVGTVSDFDGNFALESQDFTDSDLFEVSYVGFIKQPFTASELKNKRIVLRESLTELSDVVVIGTKPKSTISDNKNKLAIKLKKNKYLFAGIGGLLGLALLFVSIKKLK